MDLQTREKGITKTGIVGIATNRVLSTTKAGVGIACGSIAIVLDAVNNLTDALSSIITILGVKLAKKERDSDHPFGHGRIEYFSAIIISVIILTAGGTSFLESVKKIFNPTQADYTTVTLFVICLSVITKLILSKYVKTQGKKYNSDALSAAGADAGFDAIISCSTLVCALVSIFLNISLEGLVGAIISVFIIKSGVEMLMTSVTDVIGARPGSELAADIKSTIKSVDGVIGVYDLILHNYGPDTAIGSVHIEIPADYTARKIHKLTMDIAELVMAKYHILLTVGIYAVEQKDPEKVQKREEIEKIAASFDGVINAHGIYFNDKNKAINFDCLIDFTVKDKAKLKADIRQAVKNIYPGYNIIINFDTNFSE